MFKKQPVVLVAYMMHERKYQSYHENLINELKKTNTMLSESQVNAVTDR